MKQQRVSFYAEVTEYLKALLAKQYKALHKLPVLLLQEIIPYPLTYPTSDRYTEIWGTCGYLKAKD